MKKSFIITFQVILLISRTKLSQQTCFEYSCEECESEEYGKCTKCRDSFKLVDGTCPCADSSCSLCKSGYSGIDICSQCKDGYSIIMNNCHCSIEYCEKCSGDNSCEKCITNFFFNTTSGKCEKNEAEIKCFDQNCKTCFSTEKGACEKCEEGYTLKKGSCMKLPKVDSDGKCPDGYFKSNGVCEEICNGIDCSIEHQDFYTCASNNCLSCQNNILHINNNCDNSKDCHLDGCLICLTNDECAKCTQGRYLIEGQCKNCTSGCASCSDSTSCNYCLSGFEKDNDGQCIQTNNFDYNTSEYQSLKKQLIELYYPEEIEKETKLKNINPLSFNSPISTNFSNSSSSSIPVSSSNQIKEEKHLESCGENCINCDKNTGTCEDCETGYALINNECKKCKDNNCEKCSNDLYTCILATKGYYINNGEVMKCSDPNCEQCSSDGNSCTKCKNSYSLINNLCTNVDCENQFPNCIYCNTNKCIQCEVNYNIDSYTGKCEYQLNYAPIIYGIVASLLVITGLTVYVVYNNKKNQQNLRQNQARSRGENTVNVYSERRNSTERNIQNVEEQLNDEFDQQKLLIEKGEVPCDFCGKKFGKYINDCGCVLCKEHSKLKSIEGENGKYDACFNCEKMVKVVVPKYVCQICMHNRLALAHFKCNCALEVCKKCYIKCKMGSQKCPACRKNI